MKLKYVGGVGQQNKMIVGVVVKARRQLKVEFEKRSELLNEIVTC